MSQASRKFPLAFGHGGDNLKVCDFDLDERTIEFSPEAVEGMCRGLVKRLAQDEDQPDLAGLVRAVQQMPADQLAFAALADYCEEQGWTGIGQRFRNLGLKNGDLLIFRVEGRLQPHDKRQMREAMGPVLAFLKRHKIEVFPLILDGGMDLEVLRLTGQHHES